MFLLFIVLTLSVPQQPREVVEAYEVCQKFQTLMAEDLDFNRAFEATREIIPDDRVLGAPSSRRTNLHCPTQAIYSEQRPSNGIGSQVRRCKK